MKERTKNINAENDKKKQVKNSMLYMLPLIIGNIFPFVTLPIFTRILTKEDYGVLALVHIYGMFVCGIGNFGLILVYDRNYFQYRDSKQKTAQLLFSSLSFVCSNFIIIAILTYVFKFSLSEIITGSSIHGTLLFCSFLSNAMLMLNQYYYIYFRNSENARNFVTYSIAEKTIVFVLSIYFIVYLKVGIIGLVFSQLISYSAIFIILSCKILSRHPFLFSKEMLFESIKISYPLTPRVFFGVIDTQVSKYIIRLLASVGGAGIYKIGEQVATIVFSFMTQLEHVFIPQTYKRMFDRGEGGQKEIGKYLTPFFCHSILVALTISLFSEEIISLLTPEPYHGAINVVIILSMFYGCSVFGKISGTQLIFKKKTYVASLLTLLNIGINVGISIPFVMKWGVTGAAWAVFLSGLVYRALSFKLAQSYFEIKYEYKKIITIFMLFFGSSILLMWLRSENVYYLFRILFKLSAIIIYGYVGVKIRVITVENLILVKNQFNAFIFRDSRLKS